MKINIIHDWFSVNAGSEKVLKMLLKVFNKNHDVHLYAIFNKLNYNDKRIIMGDIACKTTFIQHLPFIHLYYKNILPILMLAIKKLKMKDADLYISSSHAIAKGFKKPAGKLHICYCHTPMRYMWYLQKDYVEHMSMFKKFFSKILLPYIQKWDTQSANNVDYFIANSFHIKQQIKEIYNRDAVVIYPPVDTKKFKLNMQPRQDYYLALGRMVSYKKIDIIIKAFLQMPDKKLIIIGDGEEITLYNKLIEHAPNISHLGYRNNAELSIYMQNAKAGIFAAKEDFGIMCVEVQSTGTPVLALRYGGYIETIQEGTTGYFFDVQEPKAIIEAVNYFEKNPLNAHESIHKHALRFDKSIFEKKVDEFISEKCKN